MNSKEFIVDRIEGNSIVIEDLNENVIILEKNLVEGNPKEGDVLIKLEDNKYIVDINATIDRKNKIQALMKGMWE